MLFRSFDTCFPLFLRLLLRETSFFPFLSDFHVFYALLVKFSVGNNFFRDFHQCSFPVKICKKNFSAKSGVICNGYSHLLFLFLLSYPSNYYFSICFLSEQKLLLWSGSVGTKNSGTAKREKRFTNKQTFEKYIDKHKRMFYTNDYKQRKER